MKFKTLLLVFLVLFDTTIARKLKSVKPVTFVKGEKLGGGFYGNVFLAHIKQSSSQLAVKFFKKRNNRR